MESRGEIIAVGVLGLVVIVMTSLGIHLHDSCSCDKDSNAAGIRNFFILMLVGGILVTLYSGGKFFMLQQMGKDVAARLEAMKSKAAEYMSRKV
jgi:hypothetical protein